MTSDRELTRVLRLVFVCVENSNRSQMAEGFARLHALESDARIEVWSAGSRPSGRVNPKAIEAMRERGIDISVQRSKSLEDLPSERFDAVVTMGCGDACPNVNAAVREDWLIPDPREMGPESFRKVRDLIEENVRDLLERLRAGRAEKKGNPRRDGQQFPPRG